MSYTKEQRIWIRDNSNNYKTIKDITNAYNLRFKESVKPHVIRSRVCVMFGNEEARKWNSKNKPSVSDLAKPNKWNELKERAKTFTPDGMKWIKNYDCYALYGKTLPTGDEIRSCYNYIELRWLI